MKITVLSPKQTVFEGEAKSVFLPGDLAEFEILDYHAPIVSLLRAGNVVVDWAKKIPIRRGMIKFDRNECMILVEEESTEMEAVERAPKSTADRARQLSCVTIHYKVQIVELATQQPISNRAAHQ